MRILSSALCVGISAGFESRRIFEARIYVVIVPQAAASERKMARESKYARSSALHHPPLPDEAPQGARGITSEIERNRGLTPHR